MEYAQSMNPSELAVMCLFLSSFLKDAEANCFSKSRSNKIQLAKKQIIKTITDHQKRVSQANITDDSPFF